jgi:hypothetical protein
MNMNDAPKRTRLLRQLSIGLIEIAYEIRIKTFETCPDRDPDVRKKFHPILMLLASTAHISGGLGE